MTSKWKDFLTITSLSTTAISGGAAWTIFLIYMTHKIPYVGIPIAALFGAIGTFETAGLVKPVVLLIKIGIKNIVNWRIFSKHNIFRLRPIVKYII